jgi:beta-barrel assembly-enhancing protease
MERDQPPASAAIRVLPFRLGVVAALGGVLTVTSACLPVASPAIAAQFPSTAAEVKLGVQVSRSFEARFRIVTDSAQMARLQRIGDALVPVVDRQDLRYRFKIMALSEVNAMSVPGGWVYVTEGMMQFARSDDELAAALAFELAHIDHRHYFIQAAHTSVSTSPLVIALASSLLAGSPIGDLEKDADLTGIAYLAKTKYSPVAMLTLTEHFAQENRFNGLLLSGLGPHPMPQERVSYIRAQLDRLHIPIVRRHVEGYLRIALDPLQPPAGVPVTIRVDGQPIVTLGATVGGVTPADRAAALAATLNTFFDQDPQPYDVRAVGIGDRWSVVGGQMELFEVAPQDAAFAQTTQEALADTIHIRLARAISSAPYIRRF